MPLDVVTNRSYSWGSIGNATAHPRKENQAIARAAAE
jgi:hypothetical protein